MTSCDPSYLSRLRERYLGKNCQLFFKQSPLTIVKADGAVIYNEKGRAFLDCINNVSHVGHCHPRVVQAASEQMALLNTNNRYLHPNIINLAKRLTSTLPDSLNVCFFVNSGSEANDLALQLAWAHTEASDVIVVDHAYHGTVTTTMQMSPYKFNKLKPGNNQMSDMVHVVPSFDIYRGKYQVGRDGDVNEVSLKYANEVTETINHLQSQGRKPAAYIVETLQGCSGQVIAPPGYLSKVFSAVKTAGGVCIADEVQSGFGRVGSHFWAFQLQGPDVIPDIVTMGKPMGNGHPVSAVVTSREIAEAFTSRGIDYFNTFGGNPVSCAVALAVLDVLEDEKLMPHAQRVGRHIIRQMKLLYKSHKSIGDVRGEGLFIGLEMVTDRVTKEPATQKAEWLHYRCKDLGVILQTDGPDNNVIKIKPPMCFSFEQADFMLHIIDKVLHELEQAENNEQTELCLPPVSSEKCFKKRFVNKTSQSGFKWPVLVAGAVFCVSLSVYVRLFYWNV